MSYNRGGAFLQDPGILLNNHRKIAQTEQQQFNQNAIGAQQDAQLGEQVQGGQNEYGAKSSYDQAYKNEQGKQLFTTILTNLANLAPGRQSVPSRNLYQEQGRSGLVDPSLTGQQTNLPMPFDERYASTANLKAMMTALPQQTYAVNEQIARTVASQIPQLQRQMVMRSTIYQQFPKDFAANRLNIAMQDRRLNSIYAVA